jgi:uncharacterized protein (TIGR03437 family)
MLLLAASLFFLPHYEVTRAPDTGVSLTTDAKGYAYVVTNSQGTQYLSKFDPDGNLIYRITPMPGPVRIQGTCLDSAGNLYAALVGGPAGGAGYVTKIDASGKVLFNYPLPVQAASAAVAADGSIYLTGDAYPYQFATTPGAWISATRAAQGSNNAFALKLSPNGQVVYATFLDASPQNGQIPYSDGIAIAVDTAGNAYVGGVTNDPGFPTTSGAYQTHCCANNSVAAFLVKLNPAGSAASYATLLPGDSVSAIVPDAAGNASLTIDQGNTTAITFAQLSAANQLSGLVTASLDLLAPPVGQGSLAAVTDGRGNILVTGAIAPAVLTTSSGAFSNGSNFVAMVRAADGALLYSSRLPNGAGGVGIGPDGGGGFVVLGANDGYFDGRQSATLTRFSPVSGPRPAIVGVTNVAGDSVSAGLAPGEMVAIYGTGLGPQTAVHGTFQGGQLPLDLAGTEVYVNGMRVPILRAGYDQVNAVVPFELPGSETVIVQVQVDGAPSNMAWLPEVPAEPCIFAILNTGGTHEGQALALNQDQTLNSQRNPAQPGSIVTIFVNGAGMLTPQPADGTLAPLGPVPVLPVQVQASLSPLPPFFNRGLTADWLDCQLLYAGSAPGEITGLLQINFRLPAASIRGPFGQIPIQVTVGGQTTISNVWTP